MQTKRTSGHVRRRAVPGPSGRQISSTQSVHTYIGSLPDWETVVSERTNTQGLLKAEIDKLRLKWEKAHPTKRHAVTPALEASTEEAPADPKTLYIVFRRLPYIIKYSTRASEAPKHVSGDDTVHWEQGIEQGGCWRLIRNQFNVDQQLLFEKLLPASCQVWIVGDPGVDFSHISEEPEVQANLKSRLETFLHSLRMVPVWLTETAKRERYSEELLYPLFHYRTPPIGTGFSYLDWPAFVEANQLFADVLGPLYQPGDWYLVFNYHLLLLPQMLRQKQNMQDALIYFYLPTVFPSSEMYRILPERQELLTGVLHSSVIGFHAHRYRLHFMTAVTRVLGVECTAHNIEPCAESGGLGVRIGVTPLGVNIEPWINAAANLNVEDLRQRFRGRKIILGVDSLDYTKGIPQKMTAFRKFLTSYPHWATKVVFVQLCFVGKRSTIDAGHSTSYRLSALDRKDILAQVYQVSGHINSSFGTVDHLPVHFLVGTFSVQELAPVYAMSDVALMSALRESICTSVYHFILCQYNTNKGVCILSEFSGSSQMLGGAILQVNPWDINTFAETIKEALTMPLEEKIARHDLAYNQVTKMDSIAWGRQILIDFREAMVDIDEDRVEVPPPLKIPEAVVDLCSAKHVIIVSGVREALLKTHTAMLDQEAIYPQSEICNYDNDPEVSQGPLLAESGSNEATGKLQPLLASQPRTPNGPSISPFIGTPLPPSPSPIAVLVPSSTESDVAALSSLPDVTVIIVSSASVKVLEKVLGDSSAIWAFAENGHLVSLPGETKFHSFYAILNQSKNEHERTDEPTEEDQEEMAECFARISELIDYFASRTPGSFMRKTEYSVSWHYGQADKRFASAQARDMLFHLYAGPLLNTKNLELCIGKTSVEVRSCKITKVMVVDWAVKEICKKHDLTPDDISILCLGNYLAKDEDIYHHAYRLTNSVPTRRLLRSSAEMSPKEATGPRRCITCTVGVRFSKAAYRLDSKTQINSLLRQLSQKLCARKAMSGNQSLPPILQPATSPTAEQQTVAYPIVKKKTADGSIMPPTMDLAFSMASPSGFSGANYYAYHPISHSEREGSKMFCSPSAPSLSPSLTQQESSSVGQHGAFGRVNSRASKIRSVGSDVEDEYDEDENESYVLGAASAALNVPNSIPFTHARPGNWMPKTVPYVQVSPPNSPWKSLIKGGTQDSSAEMAHSPSPATNTAASDQQQPSLLGKDQETRAKI